MTSDTSGQSGGDEPIARTASQLADEASRTAQQQASRGMDRAAQSLDQVVEAVHRLGDDMREQQPQIASMVDTAARQAEQASRYLREHEPREVIGGIESWARRQPALAIGGALALGLVFGRFIRSATPPGGQQHRSGQGFASGYDGGYESYGSSGYASGGGYGTVEGTEPGYGRSRNGGTGTGVGAATGYGIADESGAPTGVLAMPDSADPVDVGVIPDAAVDEGFDAGAGGTTRVTADIEGR